MSEHIQRIMDAAIYWGDKRDTGSAEARAAWRAMILRVEAEFALFLEVSRQMWDDEAGEGPTSNRGVPGLVWVRSTDTPPPAGVPVALYTPGLGIEEFVNEGPEVYPDWSPALSWWIELPAGGEAV